MRPACALWVVYILYNAGRGRVLHQLTPQHQLDKQDSETFLRQLETYYGNKFLLLQQQGIPAEANNYRHLVETLTEIKHDLDHAALEQLFIYVPTTQ